MEQYILRYNEEKKKKEIFILEDNCLVGVVEIPSNSETTHTVEEIFLDGNIITSNRGTENMFKEYGIRPIRRIYKHFKIEQDFDGEYLLRTGYTWDDGFERTFTMEDDSVLKIETETKYWRRKPMTVTTYYDCDTKYEYSYKEDKYARKKKLIYQMNKHFNTENTNLNHRR